MTDIPNLRKLLELAERVERRNGGSFQIEQEIADAMGRSRRLRLPAYTASLDAAMTLVPDGWSFEVRSSGSGDKGQASVWNPMRAPGHSEVRVAGCASPALALTAAALRARAALSETQAEEGRG